MATLINLYNLSQEELYQKLMELGKTLASIDSAEKTPDNLVSGCQSIMYLSATFDGTHVHFKAASDALISAGLAALLIDAYSGQTPDYILTTPPTFLEELGIIASLTPGRANGVASLYLKMKQSALKCLTSVS